MGGGTVTVPAGDWRLDGPIMLKSNVRLHLEEGARLHFSTHADHYLPLVLTRWEGTELFNYSPFIFAYQCTNVALTGPGVIDGHGTTTFAAWRDRQKPAQRRLRDMGGLGTAVHERIFGPDQWLRPSFVQFFGCTNVLIEGVTHVDSPFWCLHTIACHNVTVRRVRVDSIRINNDGVDIESCSDVLIEDCELRCGDDCIALKSGRDQDGWRLGRPTENVVLRRIRMEAPTTGSGLAIGSEMSGGVRAIFGEDIQIGRAPVALNIKGNLDRGGCVEQVHLRRFAVEKADTFILFTTAYQGYRGGQHPPVFRDFDIEEASCRAAVVPIHAVGVPDAPLQDIHLRRVAVEHAEQPPRIDQVSGFHADDVVINGTPWPTPVAPG
ncbi:MAG: glycoside hydrolase family 28 protein [Opitutaceae bacterium]|nr:glycoside hydrolase family 28 protein [Opitutaceae bacterium]